MVANRLRDAAAVLEVDSAYRRDAAIMREAADEVDRLRHDIERHVEIACELATECERLRAELAESKRDTLAWLPIESAPKDRTDILLRSRKGKIANGAWEPAAYAGNGCWVWPYVYIEPSYWMPIPVLAALAADGDKP